MVSNWYFRLLKSSELHQFKMEILFQFCDILKKARFGQEHSRKDLAELTHIAPCDLETLEKGQRLPTMAEIHHICQTLH